MTEKTWKAFDFIFRNYDRWNKRGLTLCFERVDDAIGMSGFNGHGIQIMSYVVLSHDDKNTLYVKEHGLEILGLNAQEQGELKEYIFNDNFPCKNTCIII